jgi:hypothetical protein
MAGIQPADGPAAAGAPGPSKPDPKLLSACQDFASLLWEEVLHVALPSDSLTGDDGSGAGQVYGGIVEQGFAQAASRGNDGLANMLLNSLSHHEQPNKVSGNTP